MAEGDETRRDATPKTAAGREGPRELALVALLGGASVEAAADAAGVSRSTTSKWLNRDPGFRADLANRRREVWGALHRRLERGATRAVERLAELVESEDPKVALGACGKLLELLNERDVLARRPLPTTREDEENRLRAEDESRLLSSRLPED